MVECVTVEGVGDSSGIGVSWLNMCCVTCSFVLRPSPTLLSLLHK